MIKAKLFTTGGSQAVRGFEGNEVNIRRDPVTGMCFFRSQPRVFWIRRLALKPLD